MSNITTFSTSDHCILETKLETLKGGPVKKSIQQKLDFLMTGRDVRKGHLYRQPRKGKLGKRRDWIPIEDRKCNVCQEIFSDRGTLRNHINVKHDKSVEHKCEECGKVYYSATSLKYHLKIHLTQEEIKHLTLANSECGYYFMSITSFTARCPCQLMRCEDTENAYLSKFQNFMRLE
jgi:hypothetical protein